MILFLECYDFHSGWNTALHEKLLKNFFLITPKAPNLGNVKSSFTGTLKSHTITSLSCHLSFFTRLHWWQTLSRSLTSFKIMLHIFIFSQKRNGSTRTIMLVDHKQNHATAVGRMCCCGQISASQR